MNPVSINISDQIESGFGRHRVPKVVQVKKNFTKIRFFGMWGHPTYVLVAHTLGALQVVISHISWLRAKKRSLQILVMQVGGYKKIEIL